MDNQDKHLKIFRILLVFSLEEVCYNGYGCFSNAPPYDISFALLPRDPGTLNTTYYWHTREENKPVVFKAPFESIPRMKAKEKTYIVTHGFIGKVQNAIF